MVFLLFIVKSKAEACALFPISSLQSTKRKHGNHQSLKQQFKMGLFGTSDPVKKEEKMLAKEAKHDDKLVKQALKDLAHTEKEEHKAQKVSIRSCPAKAAAHETSNNRLMTRPSRSTPRRSRRSTSWPNSPNVPPTPPVALGRCLHANFGAKGQLQRRLVQG